MKNENRFTIHAMPWQSGLTNQGGQATVPENALWEAKNADMDSTGRLFKRPGFSFWGQSLDSPSNGGLQYTEILNQLDNFTPVSSGGSVVATTNYEGLRLESRETSGSSLYYLRSTQGNDGTADATTATCTLLIKPGRMQTQDATLTADKGPSVHLRASGANVLTLLFLRRGGAGTNANDTAIYYYNGTNFVLASSGTTMKQGQWHKLQVRITGATSASLQIDDSSTISIASFTSYTDIAVGANQIAISGESNSNGAWDMTFNLVQYRSNTAGYMDDASIKSMREWRSIKPDTKHLLVATKDLLYDDADHTGFFRALAQAPSGDILLVPWLSELIICGSASETRRWDGGSAPVGCPLGTPSRIIAATAHQGRLFAVSADDPMTVRWSGANDLNRWSETVDGVNYVATATTVPDPRGGRITAMRGDFYGLLLIWTENSTWVLRSSGDPSRDGILSLVSANIGCIGPWAHDAIGRDVLFLGRDGLYTLSTVQEYGDVSSMSVTVQLRGLWQHDNTIDQPKVIPNRRSSVIHFPAMAKTYISVQRSGFDDINSIYVLNHDTKQWSGPWEFDSTLTDAGGGGIRCMDRVDFGIPSYQALFMATSLGDVAYLGSDRKSDFPADLDAAGYPIEFHLRSARLDGRSVNPDLVRRVKVWRQLRLYVLPRDNSNVVITWNVDGKRSSDSATRSLNVYDEPVLDTTFNLGESELGDPERIGVIYVTLDTRGRWLEFQIDIEDDTAADDKDIAIVGFEIDAVIGGEEKES